MLLEVASTQTGPLSCGAPLPENPIQTSSEKPYRLLSFFSKLIFMQKLSYSCFIVFNTFNLLYGVFDLFHSFTMFFWCVSCFNDVLFCSVKHFVILFQKGALQIKVIIIITRLLNQIQSQIYCYFTCIHTKLSRRRFLLSHGEQIRSKCWSAFTNIKKKDKKI